MKKWSKSLVGISTPILQAMKIIDESSMQIALVVDSEDQLIGVVTDGDIRRGLLQGVNLDQPVDLIFNRTFTSVREDAGRDEILSAMHERKLRHIPVLDREGRIVDLKILDEMVQVPAKDHWVVLMAGGTGSRLLPLTEDCPKPLLKVGSKPLLETILENFIEYGFGKFYVSVNYKGEMIEAFLRDGRRWGIEIRYLREPMPMGTAGALSLIPERPADSLIVMNGDVLTKINVRHLLDFHQVHKAAATMCVKNYRLDVPYGVVKTDQHRLTGIDEKPSHRLFVNAGLYVLEPDVLRFIPERAPCNMPDLFERLIAEKCEVVVFPVREYWIDVGRMDDLERANGEYPEVFR